MAENVIGSAFIQVAMAGMAKVQKDFATLKGLVAGAKEQFAAMGQTISSVGSIATRTFYGGIAAITAFTRVASPREFEKLEFASASLSIQIGRFLLPLLRELTDWLTRLSNFFKSLTDEQRQSILWFAEMTLVVSGVIMIIPSLVSAFGLVETALAAIGIESAIATGGLTVLLGAAAALLPLFLGLGAASQKVKLPDGGNLPSPGGSGESSGDQKKSPLEQLSGTLTDLISSCKAAFDQIADVVVSSLTPMIPPIVELFEVISQTLVPVITGYLVPVFSLIGNLFSTLVQIASPLIGAWLEMEAAIAEILMPLLDLWGQYLSGLASVIGALLIPLFEGLAWVVHKVATGFQWAINKFIDIINALIQWWNKQKLLPGKFKELHHVGEKPTKKTAPKTNDFRGQVKVPAAQLGSIADIWRRAQTSQVEDLQSKIAREQLAEAQKQTKVLDKINNKTNPNTPWQTPNGNI